VTLAAAKGSTAARSPSATAVIDEAAQFQAALTRRIDEWKRGGDCPTVLFAAVDERRDSPAGRSEQVAKTIIDTTVNFLRAAVREMDLVCRYDDTEFAMLLPTAELPDAAAIAERLRQAVNHCSLPVEGKYIRLSMSVGGAQAMADDDSNSLIGRAKEALRDALAKGGNCSAFHDGRELQTAEALLKGGPAPTDSR
jgi:diguanylate cyclase (GGDEF)-like protein